MAIREPEQLAVTDEMRQLARMLDAAKHGEQGQLIESAATRYGWSKAKVYKQLESVGWSSGRKKRADAGKTKVSREVLLNIGAAIRVGIRENGKATMGTPNAVSLLSVNQREIGLSNSRVNTLLRREHLSLADQRNERPVQSTKSLHPNHVHQVDPSLCLVYYLKGKQYIIRDDEFYKNKLDKIAQLKMKVWRYVLVDHYSATIVVRYYEAKGENQANLYDYLLYAWSKKDGRLFHGVPKILIWDKGSANTAGAIKNALRSLDVKAITHEAGNARAKGSVENGNNLVECLFESRLRYEPVDNVDELNAAVESWYNAYNANLIPNYDSRLKRKFMAEPQVRYGLWQMIRRDQLRILPDIALCRLLLSGADVTRPVQKDLTVAFKHPITKQREHYSVSHIPGIYIGQQVSISPLVYGEAEVVLTMTDYKDEEVTYILQPVQVDRTSGFRIDAAILGEEYKSQPDTLIDRAMKDADQQAYPGMTKDDIKKAKAKGAAPFGGLDAHSHLKHITGPAYMERPGEMLNVPDRMNLEVKPLNLIEAKIKLRAMLGRAVTADESELIKATYPQGVLPDQIDEVLQLLNAPARTQKLVAVK